MLYIQFTSVAENAARWRTVSPDPWLKSSKRPLDVSLMTITMGVKGKLDKIGRMHCL
jgi:hypothetical protein